MFWNKKEDGSNLPELPPAKPFPHPLEDSDEDDEDDEESNERHGLPSFPDSPLDKGFSQTAIKDAISQEENEEERVNLPASSKQFKTVEIEEWSPHEETSRVTTAQIAKPLALPKQDQPEQQRPAFMQPPMSAPSRPPSKNGDVFVKIDKFYSAKRALEAANVKLDEIESLLKKIREVKLREEQELTSWEKDVTTLKSRIKEVTETIFEKIE